MQTIPEVFNGKLLSIRLWIIDKVLFIYVVPLLFILNYIDSSVFLLHVILKFQSIDNGFGELSFDEIQMWHVDALKDFCRKRNLKVCGKKAELVARVFAASEMGIPIELTAVERVSETQEEKTKLLKMSDGELPDPSMLKSGWLCENESITSWPPIFLSDITIFLMADHPGRDVNIYERILNEYKEGKAYRLCEWLKEISMDHMTPDSKCCFLKANCTHSMKLTDTPHGFQL